MEFQAQDINQRTVLSPSPLNGEREGVRGGYVLTRYPQIEMGGGTTPHPQSLFPLRGEEGLILFLNRHTQTRSS